MSRLPTSPSPTCDGRIDHAPSRTKEPPGCLWAFSVIDACEGVRWTPKNGNAGVIDDEVPKRALHGRCDRKFKRWVSKQAAPVTRRTGETLRIGADGSVTVTGADGNQVRIDICWPDGNGACSPSRSHDAADVRATNAP